jgi:hypothetical protein
VQWLYAALIIGLALAVWNAGIRRYEAYGA